MAKEERRVGFGPWPQPAPRFFEDAAPAVLHVPEDVADDWNRRVGRRYLWQVISETVPTAWWAYRNRGLLPVSDERFVEILCDGIFSKFLTPDLDPPDEARFAPYLNGSRGSGRGGRWFKCDYSPMRLVPSDDDSATTPSVVLFNRDASGAYTVVAIALEDEVFDPTMEGGWTLAKYFALQGAGVLTTLLMHPKLHFPSNAVDAITRTRLRDGSVLKKLLLPHFRLALGVNYAVLYGERTVLKPGAVYSPYPGTLKEHAEIVATLWRGFEHEDGTENRAYPRYEFSLEPPVVHSPYGDFLAAYHEALLVFGREVAEVIKIEEREDIAAWADHCAEWLPGFPDASAIFEGDALARAFASLVLDVAIGHSADHYIYGEVNPREVPFRLHASVPTTSHRDEPDPGRLVTWRDNLHYMMCTKMFFQPYPVEFLHEVDYGFEHEPLREANREFLKSLKRTEQELVDNGVPRYIPLRALATSVQY